ncbi:MAG: alanine dehydrogenase [Firmicutes bacterium]|nr:alanine dehydrogenase [Bacillota bacterium]
MIVGVPKEIKANEDRVALTPAGVAELTAHGHGVVVQKGAGEGSGITDDEYVQAGATILPEAKDVFAAADMIIKVKEPLPPEYGLFRPGQILFTYLHLAPERELTLALMEKKVTAIAYETIQLENGALPLLTPMSEVAGRMSVQVGAQYLEKPNGGRGVLLGGVPGVPPADVVIVGGGTVGLNAAKIALGMGAQVTIIEKSPARLQYLDDILSGRVVTVMSNSYNIARAARFADILVGAVLIPGARAPRLVTEEMVASMKPGSVIVDVAIDQGGCVETVDHATTHADPVYVRHGVIHYSVANMPGAVPRTSTYALTNSTLPYALRLADLGFEAAVKEDPALALGVNVLDGHVTYQAVAEAHGLEYTPLEQLLS